LSFFTGISQVIGWQIGFWHQGRLFLKWPRLCRAAG